MADRSRRDPDDPDAPDYDWLYGSKRRGGRDVGGPPGADDPTEVQRSRPRFEDSARRDPEPTRMLPTVERPGSRPGASASARGPYQSPPPTRSREDGWAGPGGPSDPIGPGDRRPTGAPATGRPRGRRRFRLGWLKLALLLWVVFLVAVPLIAWSKIAKVDATPSGNRPDAQRGTTYLLVGSDSREGLTRKQQREFGTGKGAGRRTDTIMLLHTGSGPNLLMSIPRDSLVDVPGHGTTKINSAFAFGGPPLLVETIEQSTGIRIDDYVEIGFAGFVGVVDAVNGIEICPKRAMKDRLANLDIKKGCQDVDGKVALGYARSRHTSGLGDIARAQHQREVVSAVGSKAASPWSIINPVRYYRLAMAGSDSLRVGEDTGMIATMRFAWAMTRVNGTDGLTCGVPISDLAVHWDPERSRRLFKLVKEDRTDDIPKRLCRPSGLRG
jgi:LCP family protein required for cell wall assembly